MCIGYEIQTKEFITLQYRWNSINTLNEPIFFTNIFCYDNGTIHNLTNKYGNRNFITALAIEKTTNINKNKTNKYKSNTSNKSNKVRINKIENEFEELNISNLQKNISGTNVNIKKKIILLKCLWIIIKIAMI